MPFLIANWRVIVVATLLLLLGIQTWRLDRCQTQFEEFRIMTEALGRAQKAKNEADREANEQLTKEVVDAKDKAIAKLLTDGANYRRMLNDARRSRLPAKTEATPLSRACPDQSSSGVGKDQAPVPSALDKIDDATVDLLVKVQKELEKLKALYEWAQKVR